MGWWPPARAARRVISPALNRVNRLWSKVCIPWYSPSAISSSMALALDPVGSMMRSAMRPVTTMASIAGTRPYAVGPGDQALADDALAARQPGVMRTWRCWNGGKKSTIRLMVSVALVVCRRGQDQVPGLAGRQRGLDGFGVAHLADQDHVGVLAQHPPHGLGPVPGVGADLALADDRHLVRVEDLDRVLDA